MCKTSQKDAFGQIPCGMHDRKECGLATDSFLQGMAHSCMWECRAHCVVHCVLHVVDHVSHVEHYFDRLEEAGLGVRGVHVIPGGEGVGVRQGSHKHLHADQKVLQPRSDIILVVRRPVLHAATT